MIGYRSWRVTEEGKLQSLNFPFIWESTKVQATCSHGCEIGLCLREHNCNCGIYSLKSLEALRDSGYIPSTFSYYTIYGSVFNHGVVKEGTLGFQAEAVTIMSLYTADIALGKLLQENYPGVAILLPSAAILSMTKEDKKLNSYEYRWAKRQQRLKTQKLDLVMSELAFPGGPETEKVRLAGLLRNANREQIVSFAREYGGSEHFRQAFWLPRVENSRKAKPGDFVFAANSTFPAYVFLGSTRSRPETSTRYVMGRYGEVKRIVNIRKWDEEQEFLEERKRAIEEWE